MMKTYPLNINGVEFTINRDDFAWGDGEHHSTAYMLDAISRHGVKDKTVIDIGTGTGILSVLCAKLGAKEIIAIDIFDGILACAKNNFKMNNVEVKTLLNDLTKGLDYKADVVLANLYYGLQFENVKYVANNIKEGGLLIMTWKNTFKLEDYLKGFEVVEHIKNEEYDGYVLKKG